MSRAVRHPAEKSREAPHVPFEEFSVKDIDYLVRQLEKTKPAGATVEVSAMEDSHHSPCLQEMQAIVVQSVVPEGQPVETYFMYQYCPVCKLAVRVL
jgi:uncharacterized protein (DUF111 family)